MEYLLVLQVPGSWMRRHDDIIRMERRVATALVGLGKVDGHDSVSGEMEILVVTARPLEVIERLREMPEGWEFVPRLRAAYRSVDGGDFEVLDPGGPHRFRIASLGATA